MFDSEMKIILFSFKVIKDVLIKTLFAGLWRT
jgi:hypothetical protein